MGNVVNVLASLLALGLFAWFFWKYLLRGCSSNEVESDALVVYDGDKMTGLYFKGAKYRLCGDENSIKIDYPFADISAHDAASRIQTAINSHFLKPDFESIDAYLPLNAALAGEYVPSDVLAMERAVGEELSFNSLVAYELLASLTGRNC